MKTLPERAVQAAIREMERAEKSLTKEAEGLSLDMEADRAWLLGEAKGLRRALRLLQPWVKS